MNSTTEEAPPAPPAFQFTYDSSLEPYNKTATQWLADHDKHWTGLATGALVFDASGEHILLVQRAASDSMPNLWEVPGGAADAEDPSLLSACARELWEEAGLEAVRFRRAVVEGGGSGAAADPYTSRLFTNRTGTEIYCRFSFEVEVRDATRVRLDPQEHQDYLWVTEEEARNGLVGERKVTITRSQMRNLILEGFRLKREDREREKGAPTGSAPI